MLGLEENLNGLAGSELVGGVGFERAIDLSLRPLIGDIEHRGALVVNGSDRARVGDVGGEHFLPAIFGFDGVRAGEGQSGEGENFFGAGVEDELLNADTLRIGLASALILRVGPFDGCQNAFALRPILIDAVIDRPAGFHADELEGAGDFAGFYKSNGERFIVFAGIGRDDEEFNGIASAQPGGFAIEADGFFHSVGQETGEDEVVGIVFELFEVLVVGLLGGYRGQIWLLCRLVGEGDWRTEEQTNHQDSKARRATRFCEPFGEAAVLNCVFKKMPSSLVRRVAR